MLERPSTTNDNDLGSGVVDRGSNGSRGNGKGVGIALVSISSQSTVIRKMGPQVYRKNHVFYGVRIGFESFDIVQKSAAVDASSFTSSLAFAPPLRAS